jgi:hypothetical protein
MLSKRYHRKDILLRVDRERYSKLKAVAALKFKQVKELLNEIMDDYLSKHKITMEDNQ